MSKTNRVILSIFLMVISNQPMGEHPSVFSSSVIPLKHTGSTENTPIQGKALDNLVALARLFGYVQYFHPSDEATKLDWERFAILGVLTVESAQTPEELAIRLEKLFRPYAPTVEVFPKGKGCHPLELTQSSPEAQRLYTVHWRHHGYGFLDNQEDWLHDWFFSQRIYEPTLASEVVTGDFYIEAPLLKDLGGGISACIPSVLYATQDGTIPAFPLSKSIIDSFEGQPITPSGDNHATRLANIISAWNIFQHFYQYFDAVQVDWDKALETALIEASAQVDACEFRDILRKLIANLEDGHGFVDMKNGSCLHGRAIPRLIWDWIEDQLVVTDTMRVQSEKEPVERGDVILAINGVPVQTAISEEEEYISGATEERRRYLALQDLLEGDWGSMVRLKIQKVDGRIVYIDRFRDVGSLNEFNNPKTEELQPGIFYLNLDKLTQDEFTAMLPKLASAKGIIFDLRGYPGDLLITALGHLTRKTITSPQWGFPIITKPDHEDMVFEYETWNLEPSAPYLSGKKVFITDERAISFAETWLSMVSAYHLAEIVGEPSAGENCNVISEGLPEDYRMTWTGCKVLNQDGTQFHGIGIQPTIPTHRTIQGVIERVDELLEKALETVK